MNVMRPFWGMNNSGLKKNEGGVSETMRERDGDRE